MVKMVEDKCGLVLQRHDNLKCFEASCIYCWAILNKQLWVKANDPIPSAYIWPGPVFHRESGSSYDPFGPLAAVMPVIMTTWDISPLTKAAKSYGWYYDETSICSGPKKWNFLNWLGASLH